MGLVGVPEYLGALAFHCPTKDLLSGSRGERARPEEVRCSPDGDLHPAAFVGLHQLFGHPGADPTFACVGGVGQLLGERTAVCGPVHVEVLHRYELRPSARRALKHSCLQPREQLGPFVVGWVEGKVDDRSSLAGLSGEGLIRGVASYDLHAMRYSSSAAAVDYPDSPRTPLDQLVHHGHPHGPGSEDDVKLAKLAKLAIVGHRMFLLSSLVGSSGAPL